VKDLSFDEGYRNRFRRIHPYASLLGCIEDALCDGWDVDSCWIARVRRGLLFSVAEMDPATYETSEAM
jgi:hypothetical protein